MKQLSGIKEKSGYRSASALSALDLITLAYVLFSSVYILAGSAKLQDVSSHLLSRVGIIGLMLLLSFLDKVFHNKVISFIRNIYPLLLASFFYTETGYMKNIIFSRNLDATFSMIESTIWGCQPSLTFAVHFPQLWFNELMNLCYFSYYLLTLGTCFTIYFYKPQYAHRSIFMVVFSFYLYYSIYCLLPVVGPQFFFKEGILDVDTPYFFGRAMNYILTNFEVPTGAFPSSHVGIALILCYLAYMYLKKLFYIILPFAIGICFATVYLRAHYLIDVVAAFITVPLFILMSRYTYSKLLRLIYKYNPKVF